MTYKNLLADIKNAAIQSTSTINMPSNKSFYEVDLNNRIIHGPSIISVQGEHYAETVYFLVDRFYDNMDLAQTNCVIHYVINDKSYVYAVPFCDVRSYEGKIIIPWSISMSATQTSGTIQYFISFYLLDNSQLAQDYSIEGDIDNPEYIYNLNTRPASSQVLVTLSSEDFAEEDNTLNLPSYYEELIGNFINIANSSATFWTDV